MELSTISIPQETSEGLELYIKLQLGNPTLEALSCEDNTCGTHRSWKNTPGDSARSDSLPNNMTSALCGPLRLPVVPKDESILVVSSPEDRLHQP
ncbi:hypothetical protein EYF80_045055 [Liparis tanakae]|uniref:Uncharacterized protein n=1 Tax=Liparis tanakae TaxID=230148 RepID=A0A4Z2FV72_9TELE|nr:hypothetical protein EYF80_045055 [Liparis tanakae]